MDTLITERSGGVLTVTLNRPERLNAASLRMWRELAEVFTEARHRPEDRVVVVAGAGGAFCAGADLTDSEIAAAHPLVYLRAVDDAALALHRLPQPSIAKVDGVAVGAGCNLAFGCDLVVASGESRFSEIFSRRGLSVDFGGTWLLPRRVGLHKAKELAFFGEILSAPEAAELGLVNRVVARDELDEFVGDWARRLAAGPPLALSATKSMLDDSFSLGFADALEREAASQVVNLTSEDGREAISAFLEKREPIFKGR
jgi:2-(1,2-epoxy-1,2-dihydrophenyl)acetyl-CoA isomerase